MDLLWLAVILAGASIALNTLALCIAAGRSERLSNVKEKNDVR